MANSSDLIQELTDALTQDKISTDGNATFVYGQDASKLPSQVRDGAYYKGINVTTKNGCVSPRSGFIQVNFTLEDENAYFEDNNGRQIKYKQVFEKGKFQGAYPYKMDCGYRIVCIYSGLIFILNPETKTARYVEVDKEKDEFRIKGNLYEPRTQRLNQYVDRHNFSDAGTYLVIFDYPDRPVILDGYHAFRSPIGQKDTSGYPIYYVPATVMGCYNSNRLFVADASNDFTAGDPVGSTSAPYAPITFNEVYQESSEYIGQTFSLGSVNKNNAITAMGFLQVTDTSTGVGPMYIATKDTIYAYQTGQARSSWTSGNTAFGTMLLYNAGVIGPKAIDNVNSDIVFMSGDGHIRSLTVTKEYDNSWSDTPMDLEVWNYVKTTETNLSQYTIVKYAYNKIFITVNPFITESLNLNGDYTYDYAFKGMVVLEMDPTSALQSKQNPVWAGVWTGLNVQDLVKIDDTLYVFSKDPQYRNDVYIIDPDVTYDYYNDKKKNINSRIYTKQYLGNSYYTDKRERTVLLGLQNVQGKFTLNVERSNDYSNFTLWKHWEYDAPICSRDTPENLREHYFRELNLGTPVEYACNTVTGEYGDVYKGTQFRIDLSGENWRLENIMLLSDNLTSNYDENMCSIKSGLSLYKNCEEVDDWHLYSTADYVEEV